MQCRLTGFRDTPKFCQNGPAIPVNLPRNSTPTSVDDDDDEAERRR
jgi:hypothetical protein